jgi:hypothetical protein
MLLRSCAVIGNGMIAKRTPANLLTIESASTDLKEGDPRAEEQNSLVECGERRP